MQKPTENYIESTLTAAKPRFAKPLHISSRPVFPTKINPPPLARRPLEAWGKQHTDHIAAIMVFEDVSRFAIYLENEIKRTLGGIWKDSAFSETYINPLIDRLLQIRSEVESGKSGAAIVEACRLATTLSLAGPRRSFGQDPVTTTVQVGKLYHLLKRCTMHWENLEELGLWVIAMGVMEAQEPIQCGWFDCELTRISREQGITTYDEAEKILKEIIWVSSVHHSKLRSLMAYSSVMGG
jgi:hypothetical protein